MRQFTETPRTLRMSLKDIAKVLEQAVTEILMGRVAGKPKVVAFQQQRRTYLWPLGCLESSLNK